MTRLSKVFENTDQAKLIAYICALDPNWETSRRAAFSLIRSGIDVLELGVPFSDPLADGKTNQLAAERALENGATPDQVLDLVKELREEFPSLPIVLYTYYNLVFNKGVEHYVRASKEAGVDAILALDLPPEESSELTQACQTHEVDQIFLITPTTPEARIPTIVKDASGFIYYVSREGVTGERDSVASDLQEKLSSIKKHTNLPAGVGFGISNGSHVRQVAAHAEAVIVGSSIVKIIEKHGSNPDEMSRLLEEKIKDLRSGLS
ncbi:MAG: tryptophan synthase subunit alpha [Opitutales bacterium]|nr:tryptophan synthase subunit alpha [Opitutales bacterium]